MLDQNEFSVDVKNAKNKQKVVDSAENSSTSLKISGSTFDFDIDKHKRAIAIMHRMCDSELDRSLLQCASVKSAYELLKS